MSRLKYFGDCQFECEFFAHAFLSSARQRAVGMREPRFNYEDRTATKRISTVVSSFSVNLLKTPGALRDIVAVVLTLSCVP
jgi:hypothetical protein